jgi:predicted dehydrogenase
VADTAAKAKITSPARHPVDVAVVGAGARGTTFARLIAEQPHLGRVVAVAEPRRDVREAFARQHGLPPTHLFESWQDLLAGPRLADAMVIATMDRDHVGPAVAALERGYHVLLEKPMATTIEDCRAIAAARKTSGLIASVCHSLRYHRGFAEVKRVVDEGRIGEIISIDQLEQVGYWHYAHSYVRGNWRREDEAMFMLMAKSCHDIDFIAYLVGRACQRVSSFGSLSYFNERHAPPGSTARCTDGCAVELSCAFSAPRLYNDGPLRDWLPLPPEQAAHPTREARLAVLRSGPYGRCVWRSDNDVVDHQVVIMEFAGGTTATFTMTGFTAKLARKIRVHGTRGELCFEENADDPGDRLRLTTFGGNVEQIQVVPESGSHGGGDRRVVAAFLSAILSGDRSLILSDIETSLASHSIVFAAERARRSGSVEQLIDVHGGGGERPAGSVEQLIDARVDDKPRGEA